MSSISSSSSSVDSTFSEYNSSVAFNNINTAVFEFNTKLQARKYNDNVTTVPYFLYVITPNANGGLVSFSLGEMDSDQINATELDPSKPDESITFVITKHISDKLKELYAKPIPSDDSLFDSSQGEIQVAPQESTVEKIIAYYTKNTDKLATAVDDINKTYDIILETNFDDDISEMSAESDISQQPTPKKKATNEDGNDITKLPALLKLFQNKVKFERKDYIDLSKGGSRSRKHRRRHKQKKTKNTKRRNRK